MRFVWKGFIPWIEANLQHQLDSVTALLKKVSDLHNDMSQEKLDEVLNSEELTNSFIAWNHNLDHLRNAKGNFPSFWMSYIDMVGDILLGLLRASREGNWQLHLCAMALPMIVSIMRDTFMLTLLRWPISRQTIHKNYEHFANGGFSVQLAADNPFGCIPVDQTTEITLNKDTQTVGRTTKFSQKRGAVKRFYLTAEYRSGFLNQLRDMTEINQSDFHHSELQKPRTEKDEKAVSDVVDVLQNWINPFEESQDIVSLSTATVAPQEIAKDLMEAYNTGEEAYNCFKVERLEEDPPQIKFHDPMKRSRLKTFTSMVKKKRATVSGKSIILKTDRSLFGRMIVIAQSWNLHIRDIFAHPLGPLPWSLATPDGFPRKTTKAKLATHLQKCVANAEAMPNTSATVIDGMSLVQKVGHENATFGNVAAAIHSTVLREGQQSSRIDVVFDTYRETSIKNIKRTQRGEEEGLQLQNISETQMVKQ